MALPIIEKSPVTALIFLAALFTINFGFLNLILTVIVNAAQEAYEADVKYRLKRRAEEFQTAKVELKYLCEQLDVDGDGQLTRSELVEGMESNAQWAEMAAMMDCSKDEMSVIIDMLDEDKSGSVSYDEFAEQLHKMKSQEPRTLLVYIKGLLSNLKVIARDQQKVLEQGVDKKLNQLLVDFHTLSSTEPAFHRSPSWEIPTSADGTTSLCTLSRVTRPSLSYTTDFEQVAEEDWFEVKKIGGGITLFEDARDKVKADPCAGSMIYL
jgi:hypothetical protein